MTNVRNYVGVVYQKKTLDVSIPQENGTYLLAMMLLDLRVLLSIYVDFCVVMEATSSYYMPFAYYLHANQIAVSIVNPLTVNHFCKMRIRADASMLAQFGKSETPKRNQNQIIS
jgi:transposase